MTQAAGETIVVTGVGVVSALGASADETWTRILRGERGLTELTVFAADGYRNRLVAEAKDIARSAGETTSRTSDLALRAAREAIADAGLEREGRRVGLVVGGTTAGMLETESLLAVLLDRDASKNESTEALSRMLTHPLSAPTDRLARELGPFTRVRSISSACSGGANAILVGALWLELGLVDVALCGAADALCRITLAGFNALGATDPDGARPFDRRRRGLTLGEGAGFVVLERPGRKDALCTLMGWASRSEAHHITNPAPSGEAPLRAMRAALGRAGVEPARIDYVNAHGTGTPLNDPMEASALRALFGARLGEVPVSSQKGQIGHTLAAAGAIEAVFTAKAIREGVLPPTGGLEEPDDAFGLRHVRAAERRDTRVALSSSFGFGGMDTALVFGNGAVAAAPARAPRKVVVTGVATVTPRGVHVGDEVAALADTVDPGVDVAFDLGPWLDLERARRLDRGSQLAAIASMRALGAARESELPVPNEIGIILGQAFGAVDGTSAFMKRLGEKGPRFASPADFPSLVPSSPAGHVSIQLGLRGPAMVVADLAASGECAFTQAWELVAAGEAERIVACAVEERSAIVERVFHVLFRGEVEDREAIARMRKEGAAALALASEEHARASGLRALAAVEEIVAWTDRASPLEDLPPPPPGAVVVFGAPNGRGLDVVARSRWSACEAIPCAERCGSHEAIGGIALAVAVAKIARGEVPAALAVGSARGWGYAIRLTSCR